jgi:hypothetical protein
MLSASRLSRTVRDVVACPLQGEGLLHRAAAAVGLASDKAHETKEAAKDQASKGCVVTSAAAGAVVCNSNVMRPKSPPVHQCKQPPAKVAPDHGSMCNHLQV